MDQNYRRVRRTAVFTAVLCILIVIGMYMAVILPFIIPIKPPNIRKIERAFSRNQEEFYTIVEFLAESEAQSVSIWVDNGKMIADFSEQEIPDETVKKAVSRLFSQNYKMRIYKDGNTIEFFWWSHWIADIGGYIAYSTDANRIPYVQYATEIIPMSEPGWYYIISDYNQWRIEN